MRQIKIQHWIILFFLPLLTWSGCNVEEIDRGNGTPLPAGVTRLVATVRQGVQTRAVGDRLNDATINEKRVDRLAFFVHTEAEGMQVYEPAKSGETYEDFPNKVRLEAVDPADPAKGYTATVDLTAGAGYEADVIAVANLPEDYDYSQIVSWQGVLDSVTVGTFTPSMPLCTGNGGAGKDYAFVMYGSTIVALHKEKEEVFNLSLERLTARIDITNEAYVAGMETDDTKNGFMLTSVRILHARPQSYIVPQMDYVSPDVLTVSDWMAPADSIRLYKVESADKATDVTDGTPDEKATATCQRVWHSLYTYENHETEHAPTSLEIKGKFRGKEITRQIPFVVTDADGITKKPVPIVRNHRYLVQISPAQGETDITYKVTVGEWNAVDTVNVQPNQDQPPVKSGYSGTGATKVFGDPTAPDSLLFAAAADGTISFKAACPFDIKVSVDYASDADKASGEWLSITKISDATITKAGAGIERTFTIGVAKNDALDAGLVNRGYILIANAGNWSAIDTITVFQGANIAYGKTRFAAVTMGAVNGIDVVWAPVNVGATEIATNVIKDADLQNDDEKRSNDRQCGYYFQWGRKVPFTYGGETTDLAPSGTTLSMYAEATKPDYTYADKFIMDNNAWFSDYSSFGKNWPRENDPCPAGWRVPTKDELQIIYDQKPFTITDGVWTSTSTPAFVLPAVGDRNYSSGKSENRGTQGVYWSSTFESGKAYRLNTDPVLASRDLAPGYSVRCVKE